MTENEKSDVRAVVFSHLAGIALAPTVTALAGRNVFSLFGGPGNWLSLDEIEQRIRVNRGYLRVALRLLASAGWMEQRLNLNQADGGRTVTFALTPEGAVAIELAAQVYAEIVPFMGVAIGIKDCLSGKSQESFLLMLRALILRSKQGWVPDRVGDPVAARICREIRRHLDGILVGPAVVALARAGVFTELQRGPVQESAIPANREALSCIFDLLIAQGWLTRDQKNCVSLTAAGAYVGQIATSYGVTVSYLPLFTAVETLLFGDPQFPRVDKGGVELLVDRAMNVWGSGGAHKTYFKRVDEIVVEIFNRPLHLQPKGICDMGCGDATLLLHLYEVVRDQTARGKVLEDHPLMLVGADFNRVARKVAHLRLYRSKIPHCTILPGDINRPALLAADLESMGLDVHDLLHVRSFLDHNRVYAPPLAYVAGSRRARSTGAFAHRGKEIFPDELEENLVQHLRRWAPYVGRFGLIVLELHTLPPEITAANLERTLAIAYDGTHGYSDQYLVELPVFMDCAREAGLQAEMKFQGRFPASELATVSINFFTASGGDTLAVSSQHSALSIQP
ncbi:MAG: class I SAM-dependent methyltransferase [Acidobacteriia bacterium]|nr:class I SAM-dependent methyltransferase [Terriglobia bacterium]